MIIKCVSFLISNIGSIVLGGVITTLLFFFTSHPVTPLEVKNELRDISLSEINERYGEKISGGIVDKILSPELDAGAEKGVVLVGTAKISDQLYRWISIFERKTPGILDVLVGRSGFFELTSLTSFGTPYVDSLFVDKIEFIDFDEDGSSDIYVRIKSTRADSTSIGPLIFSKRGGQSWYLNTLPSISNTINQPIRNPQFLGRNPFKYFGMADESEPPLKDIKELRQFSVIEDTWSINHNGNKQDFTTLRNGGNYIFRTHPVKEHSQIQTLSFLDDGGAVLGPHYAVINMFKITENGIEADEFWNWEFPMYSNRPLRLVEIDMNSIFDAGILSHIKGDVYYGYLEYERIPIKIDRWGQDLCFN